MRHSYVLLVVFSLLAFAHASRDRIEDFCGGEVIGAVNDDVSGSLTYYFPPIGFIPPPNEDPGGPGSVDCGTSPNPRCNQTLDPNLLQGRTWYLTQDKAYFGQGYNPWNFQVYQVVCPLGHYLNLAPLGMLDLNCGAGDTLRVNTSRGDTGLICTMDDLINTGDSLYNGGRGIILPDGKASVEFCSGNSMRSGFTLRATCFNPLQVYNSPGCVSYEFFRAWDPDFVNDIFREFEEVNTTTRPHKRSAEEQAQTIENMRTQLEQLKSAENMDVQMRERKLPRTKRGVRYLFYFPESTLITYVNYQLTFQFPNGTRRSFYVTCLYVFNEEFGTRIFIRNATRQIGDTTGATMLTFFGPGHVDIVTNSDRTGRQAILRWELPVPPGRFLEIEGIQQHIIAQRIYEYIAGEWADPYPVVDNFLGGFRNPRPYPLTGFGGENFPRSVRARSQVGIVYPYVNPESECKPVIRFKDAPLQSAGIDPDILEFCAFFQHSCEPILYTACREVMFLDPFDTDPLSRSMAMMMGRGD